MEDLSKAYEGDEWKYLVIFNWLTNYTPVQKLQLYERFGGASGIFSSRREAESIFQKPFMINGKEFNAEELFEDAEREVEICRKKGIQIITINSGLYPERLINIEDPPLLIFALGNLELLSVEHAVSIVGARRASNRSITLAYTIARDLSRAGFIVISGLASGIDCYAHRGALQGQGSTIAVLGNGIDIAYPRSNYRLYDEIRERGLLISEFPLGTPPLKYNFPKRNRIISGLSQGTLVIEASVRSGALITAGYAIDQGREVMALPGSAGSEHFAGNNSLIKQGAHLVEDACDVATIMGVNWEIVEKKNKKLHFSPLECNILKVIGDDMVSIEEIGRALDSAISGIASSLTMLELKGVVVQHPGKIYSRVYDYGEE
ncbi:MAG: DNA-processing protein DprA [Spirochaetota bacterium]